MPPETQVIPINEPTAYPRAALHVLIEDKAAAHPAQEAVRFEDTVLSYAGLNESANRFARFLIAHGIGKGHTVGVMTDRSELIPVVLLGILKTGAAYIPVDPEYPEARIQYMLENAAASLLVTQKKHMGKTSTPELFLEDILVQSATLSNENPQVPVAANELAYILYTSGSTGKPKGVMVEHQSVVNLLWYLYSAGILRAEDRLLAITTISFDIAVLELFLPLIAGAQLVITNAKVSRDGSALLKLINKERISIMQATPVTWKIMLAAGWEEKLPVKILCCGEALPLDLAQRLIPRCDALYNYYGPTETTIYSTGTQVLPDAPVITIGKPVANTQIYILDEQLNETQQGQEGELYIGGDGVARGYINQPALTKERFVSTEKGRLFRTGDMGAWTPSGDIRLYGRADQQIKIRGFRIEPGEIETLLKASADVRDAVVIAREDTPGNKILVAYLETHSGTGQCLAEWKKHLQQALPDYMVPHEYIVLPGLPLTFNGKIDRSALPRPVKKSEETDTARQHVRTATEALVTRLWQEALEKNNMGIDDDFFDNGGHSLIAVEIMCKLEEETGKHLPIAALFEAPTIRLLSKFIDSGDIPSLWQSMVPVKTGGNKPPLYIVHGDGLNVMVFHSMVKHLDEDQPVFGLQPRGMDGVEEPDESIEEIAAYYISGIIKDNPHGPYLLAGYSFGGIVAFEMAKQLEQAGREVKMLAVFDTNVGNINYAGPVLQRLLKRVAIQVPKMLFILDSLRKYPKKMMAYQWHVVKRKWNTLLSKIGIAEQMETEQLSPQEKRIFEKHQHAYRNYQMEPYSGCIDLFRVEQRVYFLDDPRYLGWKGFAKEGVNIHRIPGDHKTFLMPPNDAKFAGKLQALINQCLQKKDH